MPAKKKGAEEPPPASPFQPGFAPECLACPIGLFFYSVKQTRPEVMEHVMKAFWRLRSTTAETRALAERLATGAQACASESDAAITGAATNWRFEDNALICRGLIG